MGEFYTRKRLRLPNDRELSNQMYFITICVQNREKCLCTIISAEQEDELPRCVLSKEGTIVERYIQSIPGLDRYVIMPNHIHLIVKNAEGENISSKIRSFKTLSTKNIGRSIWQRSFYDHAIRNEQDYLTRCRYIEENPIKWSLDEYYQT